MRLSIRPQPGARLEGSIRVPGDKSVAHRWLILAATGLGRSTLVEVPPALDVRSTARALTAITRKARPALHAWSSNDLPFTEAHRSTWNVRVEDEVRRPELGRLEVEGDGRAGLVAPEGPLDCGNSGTTMRLLSGVLASSPFRSTLVGDESLSARPMERIVAPLRAMGADVSTDHGHAPVDIVGGELHGTVFEPPVPSAQVKGAVLLAGLDADGVTEVREPAATRDHTERALSALGAPVESRDGAISVRRFQHEAFEAAVPGDPSSAAFLVAAAAVTGSSLTLRRVGLNPTRMHFLEVLARMGVRTEQRVESHELGEPVGTLWVAPSDGIDPVQLGPDEVPLVIDEIPLLALLAAVAGSGSTFLGVGELRVKESDRISRVVEGIRALGGDASARGDELVIAGGGLDRGRCDAGGDHRIAMGLAVAALGARGPVEVDGIESAEISFPGFVTVMRSIGAPFEDVRR
jgi:3-phosphoshikimate 1-carboxyvinyltransferase